MFGFDRRAPTQNTANGSLLGVVLVGLPFWRAKAKPELLWPMGATILGAPCLYDLSMPIIICNDDKPQTLF